jgi:predicted dehydrogenase
VAGGLAIGQVGCGNWGRHILRDLVGLGCEVVVVANSETGRRNAVDGGATDVVGHLDDLPDLAGFVVATPVPAHVEVVDALLHRRRPFFVEKPLSTDPAAVKRLADNAADLVFVMHKWRYHPGIEELGAIARSGELGPVVGLRTHRLQWGGGRDDVDTVWHLAPHDVSIALEVLGYVPTPRKAVVDYFESAVVGMIGVLGDAPWHVLEVSIRSPVRRRSVILVCRDGAAALNDAYADHLELTGRPPRSEAAPDIARRPVATELPLLRQLRAFIEHVQGGPPPRSSVSEEVELVAALARLREQAGPAGRGVR